MAGELIPVFCTAEVSLQTLSQLLEDAYAEGPDSPDALLLVHDKETIPSARDNNDLQATAPAISTGPTSAFYGATIASLVAYLRENAADESVQVSSDYLLVVDEWTDEDKTVLLVRCPTEEDEEVESVRVSSRFANAPVVAMCVGCGSVAEMRSNVDDDGIYRGGRGPAPRKGGPAPRKLLG